MANEQQRRPDRGSLFENAQKRKPSQPDMQGDCSIGGAPYELRAWKREDQLTITVAPPRGDANTYPPDSFRGALDRNTKSARAAKAAKDDPAIVAWQGDIVGDETAYNVRAFEKQGKSGPYLTLSFDSIEKPGAAPRFEPEDDDAG